jgi:hypothetical protein
MAHFDMLIQPEEGSGVFPVSLWAIHSEDAGQRLYAAPQASWFEYSRRLEQTKLMDARALGHADACIFRGEPVVQTIQCSSHDLANMGFGDAQVNLPKHLGLTALLGSREEGSGSEWKKNAPSAPRAKAIADSEQLVATAQDRSAMVSTRATAQSHTELSLSSESAGADGAAKPWQRFRDRAALLGVGIDNLSMYLVVETIDGLFDQRAVTRSQRRTSTS